MEIINPLLCQIDLFRRLLGGISNEIMLAPNLVYCGIVQRNDIVQVFCLKRHILRADVVDHGVPYRRSNVSQEQISAVGIVTLDAAEQPKRTFLHKIVK